MELRKCGALILWATLFGTFAPQAISQPADSSLAEQTKLSGTVVSSRENTLVVKTDEGGYQLFIFDHSTLKPRSIPTGSTVTVLSVPSSDPRTRLATDVVISSTPPAAEPTSVQPAGAKPAGAKPTPPKPKETPDT